MNGRPPSFRRNIVHSILGNALFTLTQLAILVVVARMGTPEGVGAMTLAIALVTPFFMLAQMGLREGHAVDDLDYFTRADYAALRLATSAAAAALVAILVLTYHAGSGWLVQSTTLAYVLVKFFDSRANMNRAIYQRAERMDYVAVSISAQGVGGLVAFTLTFWLTRDLPLAVTAQAVAISAVVHSFDRRHLRKLDARTPISEILATQPVRVGKLAVWMLPLGLSIFLVRGSLSTPPMVLQHYADLKTVGVFGAVAHVGIACLMVSNAIAAASAARLRRIYRTGSAYRFRRLAIRLIVLAAGLGAGAVIAAFLAGDWILAAVFGEPYRRGDLLMAVMAASALRIASAPMQAALSAAQAFSQRLVNTAIALVATVAAALLLIPQFGAMGAAVSLVAASAVHLALMTRSFLLLVRQREACGTAA